MAEQTTVANLKIGDIGREVRVEVEGGTASGHLWSISASATRIPIGGPMSPHEEYTPGRRTVCLDVGPFHGIEVHDDSPVTFL